MFVGEGLIQLNIANYQSSILGKHIPVFGWEVTGRNICFMSVEALGFMLCVLLFESPQIARVRSFFDMLRVTYANRGMKMIDVGVTRARSNESLMVNAGTSAKSIQHHINEYEVDEDVLAESEAVTKALLRRGHGHAQPADADNRDPYSAVGAAEEEAGTGTDDYVLLLSNLFKIYPPSFFGGKAKFAVQVRDSI